MDGLQIHYSEVRPEMGDSRSPVNTTKQVKEAPEMMLAEAVMAGGLPAAIENSEAAGQREILFSDVIPTAGCDDAALEEMGFKLGAVDEGDPLFRACELPAGWTRQGSDHNMWSYIVDERGMRRVAIFYKAAFYDRRAEAHIEREPKTAAQVDADRRFCEERSYPDWKVVSTMDGDTLVIEGYELAKGDDGRPIHEGPGRWKSTGKTETQRIAMDGSKT